MLMRKSNVLIITNKEQELLAKAQINEICKDFNMSNVIIEPEQKNTFPAILLGLMNIDDNENVIVMPSDHYISDTKTLTEQLKQANGIAKNNIVCFGIKPKNPSSEYGYIMPENEKINSYFYKIKKFIEKPDKKTAGSLIKRGAFWNSGMFMFKKSLFINEAIKHAGIKKEQLNDIEKLYKHIAPISVDYALIEKTKNAILMPAKFDWSDVGNFRSIYELFKNGENAIIGEAITINANGNLLISKKPAALIGVKNLCVINSGDFILISNINETNNIRELVELMKQKNKQLVNEPETVYRPWGSYTILDQGIGYKVKRIEVLPKKSLSLQKHMHRAEHWIIVKGKAKITIGKKTLILKENQSAYVPKKTIHKIENPFKDKIEMIEVQTGSYLGEDDIIRFTSYFDKKTKNS